MFHFQPGHAVFVIRIAPSRCQPTIFVPGVVTSLPNPHTVRARFNVRMHDGRQRSVRPMYLLHRGFCVACDLPAIEYEGMLYCPSCYQPATPEPLPDHLIVALYPWQDAHLARVASLSLRTGSDWHTAFQQHKALDYAAFQQRKALDHAAFVSMVKRVGLYQSWALCEPVWRDVNYAEMQRCALLGDAVGFQAVFDNAVCRAAGGEPQPQVAEPLAELATAPLGDMPAMVAWQTPWAGRQCGKAA